MDHPSRHSLNQELCCRCSAKKPLTCCHFCGGMVCWQCGHKASQETVKPILCHQCWHSMMKTGTPCELQPACVVTAAPGEQYLDTKYHLCTVCGLRLQLHSCLKCKAKVCQLCYIIRDSGGTVHLSCRPCSRRFILTSSASTDRQDANSLT